MYSRFFTSYLFVVALQDPAILLLLITSGEFIM